MRVLFLAALALALVRVALGPPPVFLLDDAYITLNSANFLTAASDPCFHGTRPAAAATSLVHATFAWSVAHVLPVAWALEATIWLACTAYFAGLLVLTRELTLSMRIGVLVVGIGTAGTPFHLVSGLELPVALAALTWTWIGWERRAWWAGLLAGVLPWIRPELGLVSLVAGVGAMRGRRWRMVLALGLTAGAWATWAWWLTDSLLPVTVYAKRAFFNEAAETLRDRISAFGAAIGVWVFMAGPAVAAFAMFCRRVPWIGIAITIWLCTFLPAHPSALQHNYGRYMHLLVLPLVLGATWVCETRRHLAFPLLAAAVVWSTLLLPTQHRTIVDGREQYGRELPALVSWLERHSPPGPTLVHDVGFICQTRMQLVDLVGLKSPSARQIHERLTASDGGRSRQEAIAAIACEARPRSLVVLGNWDRAFGITETLRSHGWQLAPLRQRDGASEYAVYSLDDSNVVCPSSPDESRTDAPLNRR